MQRKTWKIAFATPAFLGNAEQQAQWRTPPFKALLRQWWRILRWNDGIRDIVTLHREEGRWFGVAADDGGSSQQSQVRIHLAETWSTGSPVDWPKIAGLTHPEVKVPVQADLYLGFGPITTKSRRTAILPDAHNELRIASPDDFPLDDLLKLIAWFGTLGSRSRNGWGSLLIEGMPSPTRDDKLLQRITRPLDTCLREDWPHALGRDDNGPLIWKTAAKASWREVMQELARVKIAFRTQPRLSLDGVRDGVFADRHVLAYPVTHHSVGEWDNNARLANQLRFKVLKEGVQFIGVAFHLPCALPLQLRQPVQISRQADIWRAVHSVLDQNMTRLGANP